MTIVDENNIATVLGSKVPAAVIEALRKTLVWANSYEGSGTNPTCAAGYIRELDRAGKYAEGMKETYEYGVKYNIMYALGNLGQWRGEEARDVKRVLRKYAEEGS